MTWGTTRHSIKHEIVQYKHKLCFFHGKLMLFTCFRFYAANMQ